jgi:antitoxin CcdA
MQTEGAMRSRVNLSIDEDVLAAAKNSGINMSRVAEMALKAAAKAERNRRWNEDNKDALDAYDRFVEKNGLILDAHRQF